MKARTSLVLLLASAIAIGGSLKILSNSRKEESLQSKLIPQAVVEMNREISTLRKTRFGDADVSKIEREFAQYKFLTGARDLIYLSDPNIEKAVKYVNNSPTVGERAAFIPLFYGGCMATLVGLGGLIKKGARGVGTMIDDIRGYGKWMS